MRASPGTAPLPWSDAAVRRAFWWLLFVALLVLGAGMGLRDPWPSDEPRFALVARQMVASGDWLFPHRGSELYADKPPMLMWLEALSYLVVREWRIAFLLPSLLSGLLTLVLTYDLGRRLWNPATGLLAAGLVLASIQFVFQSKRAQIDPLVMALITLANWGLLRHLLLGPDWRAYWLGCLAAGLGVITKGVGVIALLLLVPYLFARWRGWPGVAQTRGDGWRWAAGLLALLLPIAAWLVPMLLVAQARGGPEYQAYVHDILLRQTAKRYGGSVGGHAQPFWYYLPVLLLHFFPMSLLYIAAARRWVDGWRQRDARYLLLLGWCALVLLFFSMAGGKREVYVMPMLPLLALALAPTLAQVLHARWLRWACWVAAVLLGALLVGAGAAALGGHWGRAAEMAADRALADGGRSLWWMLLAMGALFGVAALVWRPRGGVAALCTGIAGFWVLFGLWSSPLLNDGSSAAGVMRNAGTIAGPQAEIALVAWKEQNLFMADRPVRDFGFKKRWDYQFKEAVAWQAEAPAQRWVFALADAVTPCVDPARAVDAGTANNRRFLMFRADAVVSGCQPVVPAGAERWDENRAADEGE
jgi:4-amino-4-deoxy-L-arabinose transferase-like glycosyltransferase